MLRGRPVVRVVFSGEYRGKIHAGVGQAAKENDLFLDDCAIDVATEEVRLAADGVLVVCGEERDGVAALRRMGRRAERVPVEMVCVSSAPVIAKEQSDCWRPDWAAAGVLLARHVQALQLPQVVCWQRRKASRLWQGFARELTRLGHSLAGNWCLEEEFFPKEDSVFSVDAQAWLLRKLALLPRPSVVVAEDDEMAYLVVMAARRLHLRVPEHVSVIGVGNCAAVLEKSPVSLSSVDMNWSRLGYLAASRLAGRLQGSGKEEEISRLAVVPQGVVERESTRQFYSEDEAVARTVRRIRRDFSEPLSVRILAREAGISVPLLHARYSKMTGVTIMRSLREIRLAAAAARLREGCLKLESIADETGLGDVRNLFRLFKEHYGVTPTQYRELHQHPEEGLNSLLGLG